MKVALCFIISYKHILNKEKLWIEWIEPNKDIINIYFHYKNIHLIKSPWIKLYTIPPKYIQKTTYFNVVPAYMSVLYYAYEHDKNNVWFCLLTDSCVPIISPAKFRELFLNHYQVSIIRCMPAYWDINLHFRANLRMLSKEFRLANDPWFTLCRDHVYKCILFFTYRNGTFNQINNGGLANESLFAIILQTFGELTNPIRLINDSSTLCDWKHMSSPTSPNIFKDASPENINIISKLLKEHKYAMFLRKVTSSFPDKTIKDFMNLDFNHNYDILHNQAKKKCKSTFFCDNLHYFIILFGFLILPFILFY
jgi:hypothetical protein